MTRYFHLVGEKIPHKDQIHLPSWESQKDIYKSDMQLQQIPKIEMVALSSFIVFGPMIFLTLSFQR